METWITFVCAAVVTVGLVGIAWSRIRDYRESSRGWRTAIELGGIRYEEKKDGVWNSLLVRATRRGHGFGELLVPTDAIWNSRHPEWARKRREEIIARIRSEASALPCIEEPIQQPQQQRP
jgi:GNAT superfamily N-acetyltransferase